ncbi:MAG: 3-alpha domain-containing protein [bacterium]
MILLERPFPQWTVARASEIMRHRREGPEAAVELAACPLLSARWRETLSADVSSGVDRDPEPGLEGLK